MDWFGLGRGSLSSDARRLADGTLRRALATALARRAPPTPLTAPLDRCAPPLPMVLVTEPPLVLVRTLTVRLCQASLAKVSVESVESVESMALELEADEVWAMRATTASIWV